MHNPKVSAMWDGITACVVGLAGITAIRFVKSSVGTDPLAGLILAATLAVLMTVQHPFLSTFIIAAAAIVGQFFYSPAHY